ncbi:MAG: hypothetical protein VR65_08195 [Desulfobulbaceae bacterium BRH_c16a]|nr:MAG: hypothetical protein VR65_08195 [Desulfobulbaceae bacterium BRH_c16a]
MGAETISHQRICLYSVYSCKKDTNLRDGRELQPRKTEEETQSVSIKAQPGFFCHFSDNFSKIWPLNNPFISLWSCIPGIEKAVFLKVKMVMLTLSLLKMTAGVFR